MVECSFTKYVVVGSSPAAVNYTSDTAPVLSKNFLEIHEITECKFILKNEFRKIKRKAQKFFFIYLLKVNIRDSRTRCKISSNLTIKTTERRVLSSGI